MKVVSWNIYRSNADTERVVRFLETYPADIVCLQECTSAHVRRLQALDGFYIFSSEIREERRFDKGRSHSMFLVCISRTPFLGSGQIEHTEMEQYTRRTWRYRSFKATSAYVDVMHNGTMVRIFNLHLRCVASPSARIRQFEEALALQDASKVNIFCGDLNTFARTPINILVAPYMGYFPSEIFWNDRKKFQTLFTLHRLNNIFAGKTTLALIPLQYDYILVPERVLVATNTVIQNRYGSDHNPIFVELAPS